MELKEMVKFQFGANLLWNRLWDIDTNEAIQEFEASHGHEHLGIWEILMRIWESERSTRYGIGGLDSSSLDLKGQGGKP